MIPNDRPVYRILGNFFGPDCHLYGEGEIIAFEGEPNEDMEPLNEMAKTRMKAFFDKLDKEARKVAEKAGREYAGRPRSLEDAIALSRADAREMQTVRNGPGLPVMGATPDTKSIERITPDQAAPETTRRGRGTLSLSTRT